MAHCLTSPYYASSYETFEVDDKDTLGRPGMPDGESGGAQDPHKELMAQMLYQARVILEGFRDSCGGWDKYTDCTVRKFRTVLRPVVQVLAWLAEPAKVGAAGITLNQCCECLNLDAEQVHTLLVDIFQGTPHDGVRAIHRYVNRMLSDVQFSSTHYNDSPLGRAWHGLGRCD